MNFSCSLHHHQLTKLSFWKGEAKKVSVGCHQFLVLAVHWPSAFPVEIISSRFKVQTRGKIGMAPNALLPMAMQGRSILQCSYLFKVQQEHFLTGKK